MSPEAAAPSPAPISRKRYERGFWCASVLTWSVYFGQWALCFWVQSRYLPFLQNMVTGNNADWFWGILFLLELFFLEATAWTSGMAAAFFWRTNLPEAQEKRAVLNSVWLAWAPTIVLTCSWCVLWIFFLAYLWTYRAGLKYGKTFWFSPRARQWLGDFSNRNDQEREA